MLHITDAAVCSADHKAPLIEYQLSFIRSLPLSAFPLLQLRKSRGKLKVCHGISITSLLKFPVIMLDLHKNHSFYSFVPDLDDHNLLKC